MIIIRRPLLAATVADIESLDYPVLASPKLDGIRVLVNPGGEHPVVTRKMKPVPNRYVVAELSKLCGQLDGEIIVGHPTAPGVFHASQSAVMRGGGEPDFHYYVFDRVDAPSAHTYFHGRIIYARSHADWGGCLRVSVLPHTVLGCHEALREYEEHCIGEGYEGVMIRSPGGVYKQGRSTLKEGVLLKLKRFTDIEVEVVGLVEKEHNTNEFERDERGYAKRSSAKAGMVPAGTLGSLIVKSPDYAQPFGVGLRLDAATRQAMWDNRSACIGRTGTIRFQGCGTKDVPRFGVFIGFREDL